MCGRFTQKLTWKELNRLYRMPQARTPLNLQPRYNGAPTQVFAACRLGEDGRREIAKLRWGLVPFWAKDIRIGSRMINARAETVDSKPAFRAAFRQRRCLVPADGWFEWARVEGGKQPYYVTLADGTPISFAGLWERWNREGELVETFTIITTEAVPELVGIHNRQPAIVAPDHHAEWLDPASPATRLLELARKPYQGWFECRPVGAAVNNVRNDHPGVLECE